jgi:glutamate formiminotransferase
MPALFQCVPNFSEGRDAGVIGELVRSVQILRGVKVVEWSADVDHHRMVLTLVGDAEGLAEAAFVLAREAVARIDLVAHQGVHPRMGALDVLPFVPLEGTTMAEAVDLAHRVGARIGSELGIPVYFYEAAALAPARRNLAAVRTGGFERLSEAGELTGDLAPDAGPTRVHPTAGAVAVGARGRLLAFNVNLSTTEVRIAQAIAKEIRERNGGMAGVKALGLGLEDTGVAQVSINITRPDEIALHEVFEEVRRRAALHGVEVSKSELIGSLRLEDVLAAVRHYLALPGLRREQVLDLALSELPET